MHVGYILKKFPRASETFILNEILALQRQGVEVTVFSLHKPDDGVFHRGLADLQRPVVYVAPRKGDGWLAYLRENIDRFSLLAPQLLGQLQDMLRAGRQDVWNVLGWAIDIAAAAEEHGVAHFHAHFATVAAHTARAAAAIAGLPFSVTCHAKDIYRTGIDPASFQSLLAPANFVVTVCEANRRWIQAQLAPEGSIPLLVLYNGVDTTHFDVRHRQPATEPFVLAVGRLVEKKGFHHLLDALSALSREGVSPRCLIVGDGDERDALKLQCQSLGLDRVEFLGMRTQDEVRELMLSATMLVLPCIIGEDGNRDALPTVLLEALASGLPAISTAVGGVEEILDDGRAGLLVPAGEVAPLAECIARLWSADDLRQELAAKGRARALSHFDLMANVARLRGFMFPSVKRACDPAETSA
ncbi:MAG: colanic acid/amylovoran biosynthesis glycosyltransferase [Planctomycetota bacterium]|jgi:colanic acid/amylovoran biosynthesis glycosyltransferase